MESQSWNIWREVFSWQLWPPGGGGEPGFYELELLLSRLDKNALPPDIMLIYRLTKERFEGLYFTLFELYEVKSQGLLQMQCRLSAYSVVELFCHAQDTISNEAEISVPTIIKSR